MRLIKTILKPRASRNKSFIESVEYNISQGNNKREFHGKQGRKFIDFRSNSSDLFAGFLFVCSFLMDGVLF